MGRQEVVVVALRRNADDNAIYGTFNWDGQAMIYSAYDRYALDEHVTVNGHVLKICDASMREIRALRPPVATLLHRAFERLRDEVERHRRIAQPIIDEIKRLEYEREQLHDRPEGSVG